jgi:hypothetical protein
MKKLLSILLILFLLGCSESGSDGENGIDGADNTGDTSSDSSEEIKYSLNGKAENGPCMKPGSILIYPLNIDLYQTGNPIYGYINDDTGSFAARGTASGSWAFYVAENLTCYDEISGAYDTGIKFFSLPDLSSSERNLNPLTTIEYLTAIEYFDDSLHLCYQDYDCAALTAHDNILSFFDMPATTVKFSQMTLQGDTQADAILAIVNSMVTNGRNGNEQNSYMLNIARGVLNNDLVLKADIQNQINALPIKTIKTNLENVYTDLGIGPRCPPIWDLSPHNEYADLLFRTPTILESFNLNSSVLCTFDTNGYNSFAYPVVFNNIEDLGKYIATELNADGDYSIWSVGTYNQGVDYLGPSIQLVTIEQLNEVLLEPALIYNGFLGNHGLINGEQYFIVQFFDDLNHRPTHTCDGDMVPFGRILATVDNNWSAAIGWNNTTSWFRRMPKIFITD